MISFKHILCPIDFSDTSARALGYAAAISAWYQAPLKRLRAQLAGEPRTWCAIEEVVATNRAYEEILQRAAASDVDLIVMGAHGSSGIELMLYGSNTHHVVRSATCPVLTVRA